MQNKPQHEKLLVLADVMTILATQEQTNGQYVIVDNQVPPLGGPPPHTHPDEEIFYVLSGVFDFILHDLHKPIRARTGDVIKVPSMAVHTFKNVGEGEGRLLTIIAPGKLEAFFREIGTPVTADTQLPNLNVPPDFSRLDVGKVFAAAARHEVSFYVPENIPA